MSTNDEEILVLIGERIRQRRKDFKMTQNQLAEKMGLSDVAELLKGKKAREKKRFEKKHGTQGKTASGKRR